MTMCEKSTLENVCFVAYKCFPIQTMISFISFDIWTFTTLLARQTTCKKKLEEFKWNILESLKITEDQ